MATITSAQNWLASATATWVWWVVPIEWDKVIISHEVTLDWDRLWGDDTKTAITILNGTLKFSRTVSSVLTCKWKLIVSDNTASYLDMGITWDIIPKWIHARIILNYSDSLAENKYGLTVNNRGQFRTHWAIKNQVSKLTSDLLIGGTSVDVEDITDWEIWEEICLPTNGDYTKTSFATITNIVWNTLTLNNFYRRWSDTPTATCSFEHKAETQVFNVSSNVSIRGYDRYTKSYVDNRANINTQTREFNYTEFSFMDEDPSTWFNQWVSFYILIEGAITSFKNNIFKHWDRWLDIYAWVSPILIENCILCDVLSTWW